ncbi:MAG: integrase catalytic domain-containing protein [Synergistaceae bacterium]|nr:integrase catalytic domain-containing protein [Synergistaceae bacterium]
MLLKYNILLYIQKNKEGTAGPLRMRVRWGSHILTYNLGVTVEVSKWDKDLQRCRRNTTHGKMQLPAATINAAINAYVEAAVTTFASFQVEGRTPSEEEFRAKFAKNDPDADRRGTASRDSIPQLVREYLHDMRTRKMWSDGTLTIALQALQPLTTDKAPERLTEDWAQKWLERRIREGMENTTIKARLNHIKTFARWAGERMESKGLLEFNPRLKTADKEVFFLTAEELERFTATDVHKTMQASKDIFLIQCHTGLRFSDASTLRWGQIEGDSLNVTIRKTKKTVKIPTDGTVRAILDRWRAERGQSEEIFGRIKLETVNDHLKVIARLAGINSLVSVPHVTGGTSRIETREKWELVSTHCGRRTFVCMLLSAGVSPQVVMRMTGHSNYNAMKPYIDVTDGSKEEAVRKLNELMR